MKEVRGDKNGWLLSKLHHLMEYGLLRISAVLFGAQSAPDVRLLV